MKEPPYDDAVVPAVVLFVAAVLFVAGLGVAGYVLREWAEFVPPPSSLPPLK